jgi:hypothetical protein
VFRLATEEPRPEWIGVVAPLMTRVDPATEAGGKKHSTLYYSLLSVAGGVQKQQFPGPLDLSPFADFVVACGSRVANHASPGGDLRKLTAFMGARAKTTVALGFLESVKAGLRPDGMFDRFLMEQAVRLAAEAPDPSLVDALSTLVAAVQTCPRLVDPLLALGSAILGGLPAERARVQQFLDPLIDLETPPSRDSLARYVESLGDGEEPGPRPLSAGLKGYFEAARLAARSPAPWLVDALLQMDPRKQPSYESKVTAMAMLLDVCCTLVAAFPEQRHRVQEVLQPRIDEGRLIGKVPSRYLEIVGEPPKGEPEETTFELRAGEAKRLPTALNISYERRDDGWYKVSFLRNRKGLGWGLNPAIESYREGWVEPYIVTAHRTASSEDRLLISLLPQAAKPSPLQDPEGCRMAEPLAAKAGCPDCEEHACRPGDGCFEYRARGPDGKTCTILIGTLTRKVVREGPSPAQPAG